jgi:hypothetical protein
VELVGADKYLHFDELPRPDLFRAVVFVFAKECERYTSALGDMEFKP